MMDLEQVAVRPGRSMVRARFQNPLLRRMLQLWWLPALVWPVLWVLLGGRWVPWPLLHPGWAAITYGTALAGMIGAVCLHAGGVALRESLRHGRAGHRFLCPHCLHFGEFYVACSACEGEIEPLIVHTRGVYVNECPHCRAVICSRDGERGEGVRAYCSHCSRVCGRDLHHERQVRVMGVLRTSDFSALCGALRKRPAHVSGRIDRRYHDDGACLTFVLSLEALPDSDDLVHPTHALWAVECIWLDGNDVEPLWVGEAVDRFLNRTRLSAAQRQSMTICIGGDPPDAVRRLLAARFGTVVCGVTPAGLIGTGASDVLAPQGAFSLRFLRHSRTRPGKAGTSGRSWR